LGSKDSKVSGFGGRYSITVVWKTVSSIVFAFPVLCLGYLRRVFGSSTNATASDGIPPGAQASLSSWRGMPLREGKIEDNHRAVDRVLDRVFDRVFDRLGFLRAGFGFLTA
jgi:hypothetical protein